MCLRGLSRPAGAKKFSRNDEKQAENDEDSNNGNKRLTGTNADVVSMHACRVNTPEHSPGAYM